MGWRGPGTLLRGPSGDASGLAEYADPGVRSSLLDFYVPNQSGFDSILQQRRLVEDLPNLRNRVDALASRLSGTEQGLLTQSRSINDLLNKYNGLSSYVGTEIPKVRDQAKKAIETAIEAHALVDQAWEEIQNRMPGKIQDVVDCAWSSAVNKSTILGDRVRIRLADVGNMASSIAGTLGGTVRNSFEAIRATAERWAPGNLRDQASSGESGLSFGGGQTYRADWKDRFGTAQSAIITWPGSSDVGANGIVGLTKARKDVESQIWDFAERYRYDAIMLIVDQGTRDRNAASLRASIKGAHNWARGIEAAIAKSWIDGMMGGLLMPIQNIGGALNTRLAEVRNALDQLAADIAARRSALSADAKELGEGSLGLSPRCVWGGGSGGGIIGGGGGVEPEPIGTTQRFRQETTDLNSGRQPKRGTAFSRYTDEDQDGGPSLI